MIEWKLVPVEPTEAMLIAAGATPEGVTPLGGVDRLRKMLPRYYRAMLAAAPQPGEPSPYVILANARRIASARYRRSPNWVLAMDVFGLGSTSASAICERFGIDPDALTIRAEAESTGGGDA